MLKNTFLTSCPDALELESFGSRRLHMLPGTKSTLNPYLLAPYETLVTPKRHLGQGQKAKLLT